MNEFIKSDITLKQENRDVTTGLKTKTHAGRPNWEKAFQKIRDENHGVVTVFYCGNPHLAKILRRKCENFGFNFRKEVFQNQKEDTFLKPESYFTYGILMKGRVK